MNIGQLQVEEYNQGQRESLAVGASSAANAGFATNAGNAAFATNAGTAAAVSGPVSCLRKKYYLSESFPTGATATTACVAGYHFASLAEIWDPSGLDYAQNGVDVPAGTAHVLPDSGKGPPFSSLGFVRIGVTGTANSVPGNANCISGSVPWSTASSTVFGTAVALQPIWSNAPIAISPWDTQVRRCDNPSSPAPQVHAWCVQD